VLDREAHGNLGVRAGTRKGGSCLTFLSGTP
jgi:hypothetical protein